MEQKQIVLTQQVSIFWKIGISTKICFQRFLKIHCLRALLSGSLTIQNTLQEHYEADQLNTTSPHVVQLLETGKNPTMRNSY